MTALNDPLPPPVPSKAFLDRLAQRRSAPAQALVAPGPSPAELDHILALGARTPDHGKLFPWRFIVLEDAAKAEVRAMAATRLRRHLERIQSWVAAAAPYWNGEHLSPHDAYAFTLLRWGGFAGINPDDLPGYKAYIGRVMAAAPVTAALERERIKLDTYKSA